MNDRDQVSLHILASWRRSVLRLTVPASALGACLLCALLTSLVSVSQVDAESEWKIQTVDSGGNTNGLPALAFGPSGPAIAYFDFSNGNLKFAYDSNNDGDFADSGEIQTVANGSVGHWSSLAFGPLGPAISYYDSANEDLRFAYDTNGDGDFDDPGEIQTVDSDGDVGLLSSLAFGPSGPGISYMDDTNGCLKFAYDANGDGDFDDPGETQVVDNDHASWWSSLAFGPLGAAISYHNCSNLDLKFAYDMNGDGDFGNPGEIQSVDTDVGGSSSLAFGPLGPAISYHDYYSYDFKFAYDTNGDGDFNDPGEMQAIDSNVTGKSSLAFGSSGPAISYYDESSQELKFAHDTNGDGDFADQGEIQTVDSEVGPCTSLAFGPSGPGISYYDASNGDLKFARKTALPPLPEEILTDTFSPVLYVNCRDTVVQDYQPRPVEALLHNSKLKDHSEEDTVLKDAPQLKDLTGVSESCYLDFPGNPTEDGDDAYWGKSDQVDADYPVCTYARICDPAENEGHVILQYWLFYYYNHWPQLPRGWVGNGPRDWDDHEGDWELIQLVFPEGWNPSELVAMDIVPESIVYSAHRPVGPVCKGCYEMTWNEQGFLRNGNHPVAYVAVGGHANYFRTGAKTWVDKELIGCDYVLGPGTKDPDGRSMATQCLPVPVLATDSEYELKDDYAWMEFLGRWGECDWDLHDPPFPTVSKGAWGPQLCEHDAWVRPYDYWKAAGDPPSMDDLVVMAPSQAWFTVESGANSLTTDGVSVVENEFRGARFFLWDNTQVVYIPTTGDEQEFVVRFDATETGDYDLQIVAPGLYSEPMGTSTQASTSAGLIHWLSYVDVPLTESMIGEIGLDSADDFDLHLDEDGDGTFESSVCPSAQQDIVLTGAPDDETAPGETTDLSVVESARSSLALEWTAPGDDGHDGSAAMYDLRYSTAPMTTESWYSAERVHIDRSPQTSGTTETVTVGGLLPGTMYHFALMAGDEVTNWSALSNVASGETLPGVEGDTTCDGVTNIVDAMFIAQYTVGLRDFDACQMLCGDTTDDGEVNIVDAMHIAQFTVDPIGAGGVLFKPLWESPADDSLLDPLDG